VDQNQRAAGACRDEIGADDSLPHTRRRHEHADIMRAQRFDGSLLHAREFPLKLKSWRVATGSLVIDF
jgi:hypothetical protein